MVLFAPEDSNYLPGYETTLPKKNEAKDRQDSIKAIIAEVAQAAAAEEAAALAATKEAKAKAELAAEKEARRKERATKKHDTPEDKEANKEKRLMKLVGAVVVKCMSKHAKSFDREEFKKHAKEVCSMALDSLVI